MTQEILNVAYAEYRKWHEKIKDSEAYQNMKGWERVILSQGGTLPLETAAEKQVSATEPLRIVTPKKGGRIGIMAQVRQCSAEFIRMKGGHAHREDIQSYLASKGLDVSLRKLSVYLSEAKEFKPNRKKGWSVKELAAA